MFQENGEGERQEEVANTTQEGGDVGMEISTL